MNEEALKDSYSLFTNTGYNGTQDEFYTLLSDNAEAFADSYGLFKDSGYNGSEDDYKELLGLKKKDVSVLQGANAQTVSEVTPSTSDLSQPSLEQDVQSSLEERFSGYKDLPEDEQKSLRKQEELRPFFEANGLDLDEKLSFENKKKSLEEADRKEEEADEELGFFERLYKNITSPEEVEDMFTTEEDSVNNYFAQNSDKIFEAEKQYNQAKVEQIKSNYPPQERLAQFKAEGIDLGYIPIKNLKINGEEVSIKEFEKKAYDQEFIDQLQAGEVSMEVLDTQDNEVLENLNNLMTRQMESGGQWGDIAQSFYAGGLDMLVAGPLNLLERVGTQGNLYEQTMYKLRGGYWANKVHKYANSQRDKTRLYEQSSMTESLLSGNYGNAMFQAGNALAESTPLILGMYASAPLGLAEGATLGFAGISAGSLKDLELREQRLKGEIDISEAMILANSVLTGGAEMFFEKFTLDGINAGRKIAGLGKMKPTEIADKFVKGFSKQTAIEGLSEGATEFSNAITDLITGSAEYEGIEEIAVRISDATLVGGLMGGGMHTAPYLYQSLKKFEILDENISTVFTMEDGSVKEMSRAEALRFVKDPEVSDQIRRSVIKMDASMNDVAKKQLEEIIYGYYAPDAVESRARMFDKEKAVQQVLNKVEVSEEVSTEDLNTLSEAMAEMEIEGKESKYNISSSTKSTRARAASVLKGKGVEIVNATQTQDLSGSNITETVNVSKIETKEQYDSVKKQIKNKSNKPKIVVSESQQSITVNGESVQSSEVVQGTFKNLNEAKNALKDFEIADKAAKAGEMLESDLFPANNKLFLQTKKEGLDDIPKEVIDNNDYHVLTSEKEGLTQEERDSRMSELKSMLDEAGATYYTVQGVYNGVAEESLVVTGIDNATALNIGNAFQQESIFSSKDGLMYGDGRVVPLKGGKPVKGPEARKMDALTIMNVGGRKVSLHSGLDWNNTSYGKNFNSENLHKLDESNADYDAELFQGITEDRKRALGFALKLLNSIGGLNVTVIRNSEAMKGQMESLGLDEKIVESGKRSSFFRGADKTIYVNLETVRGNTLFHEIIHPMVDFIKKTDPALYKRIEAEVAEGKVKRRITKGGRKIKGSYLEWAEANYANLSREGQIEEAFAEMMGDAAYGHFKNKGTRLNRLREVIKAILTKLGVTSLPENVEAIDLDDMSLSDIRTNLAEALVDGRKVNVGGVEFEVGETDAESRFQLDAIDRRTQIQYTYDVNSKEFADMEADGLITSGMTIQDFKGKTMMIHAPDALFSGSIIDTDGTILAEGKGGILYPFVFNEKGYFWASTDDKAVLMSKQLNSTLDANGGKIYMALTTAPQNKLLSSTAASRGIVNLLTSNNFISKIGLSKPTLYKALIDAANQTSPLGDGLKLGLKPYRASSKFEGDVLEKVWDKLDNKKTSFEDRKFFTNKFLTLSRQSLESESSKTNFVNFIKTTEPNLSYVDFTKSGAGSITKMKKSIINILTEPGLREKDGQTNRIYAVLEIDGPVKAIKTDEYESYGTAIVSESGNRAKIHRLDNREFWYDVAEDPMTNTVIGETTGRSSSGKISSRRSQIMPAMAGVSTTPLKISEEIRMQAPTYEMEYTPNSLISLSMLSDNNRQPEQWVKEIGKGLKGASKDVDTMGLLDILKAYKKDAKVKSIPKEVVAQLIATNMADIETVILSEETKSVASYDDFNIEIDGDRLLVQFPDGIGRDYSSIDIDSWQSYKVTDAEVIEDALDNYGYTGGLSTYVREEAGPMAPKYSETTLPGGANYREFLIKDKSPEDVFSAPHYDEFGENLIASARVDDRVGPNGEKILFVQEIQSDWVQGVNKDNFATKENISDISKQLEDLKSLEVRISSDIVDGKKTKEEAKELLEGISDTRVDLQRMLNGLRPYLPWNQTDLWVGLTIRKLINQASKEGYDQIAFVNGEQSDRVQGHTDGRTAEFYNKIVPKNINNELKRLVKGMKHELGEVSSSSNYRFRDFKLYDPSVPQLVSEDGGVSKLYKLDDNRNVMLTINYDNVADVEKNMVSSYSVNTMGETKNYPLKKGTNINEAQPIREKIMTDITRSLGEQKQNVIVNLTPELKAATDKIGPLRFQAPQEEGESNVYTDGLVSIGWDISKAMQDLNYMSGTYLTGFIDQKAFDSKDKQRYDIKLTALLAKPFGTHSDKEVKEIMVRSRGALNSAIIEANEVGKRLKELNEKYNYTEQELNDFLHDHNKIKALEDSDIKNTLIEMRMSIDDLSKTLISEDLIAGQTMFTVDSNLGLYVTKAYKNFEVKGWEQTDNLIIQKTKDFLYKEAKKDNPEATEERLNDIVKVNYRKLNSDKNFAYNIKNGGSLDGLSRLTSIFKQRKEIPQEIKDFWGEIDDPIFNYNNTVKKIAQTITAERMYKDLYEIGNGKFISDTQTSETFNKLVGSKWGSLEGKFVDNEMFAVMNQMSPEKGEGLFNFVYDKYMELVLLNKKTKTVWNPGTHVKNIIGNTAFATMNGHINMNVGTMYQDAKASIKATMGSSNAELDVIRKNLIEKGVLSSSASLQEIRNISKDLGETDYDLSKYLDEKRGKIGKLMAKTVRYLGKPLKSLDDKSTRAYQAEDDVWKFYGFLSEKARYIEAGISEKEADDMAARNIINLYPNYNEIPRIIRVIGRSPIVGSFVAFQAESFRNAKNAVKLGFEEMGSSNPKIKRIGTTRIAGTIATMTLLEGLQLYTMQFLSQALGLAGGDEEESEERRLRTMVAEWDRDGSLAYVDSGVLDSKTNENQMENDKYFDYINFSSISGVGHIRDILRLSFTDIDTEVGKESAYSIVKKMFEPFLGEEMTLATFLEAYENKGDRIYSRTDDAGTATLKMIEYVGKKVAMPGIGRNAIRIMESFEQDSERVPTYEALALFGLRISRTNLNKTLSINARNAYNDMRSRSSDKIIRDKTLLLNEIKNNPDLDNDLNIIADLMAGCRLNKVAGRDTKAILKGMGISDVVIDLAYNRMLKNYKQDVLSVDAK